MNHQQSFFKKMLIHLLLHTVEVICTYHKTMQRRAHILSQEHFHRARNDLLVRVTHSCQPKALCFLIIGSDLFVLLDFE